ncbi:hypothetical protein DFH06DRAFT_990482, partial [Mycena polygramma]
STRNTRIERLWVEVGTQFARRWRAFFTRLGRLYRLDRKNPSHLWLLHRLFLPDINDDCRDFQDEWNLHPISGRLTNDQSPADIRFLGQTTEGIYCHDPLDGIHPDAINRYYGVAGARCRRSRGQTGAGIASDDEGDESGDESDTEPTPEEEMENQIEGDLSQNIRHQPVKVARHHSPFDDPDSEETFLDLLEEVLSGPDLPENYGILEDEWEEDDYPEIESIKPGTSGKELLIVLPRAEWFPKAAQWVRALDLLTRCLHELQEEAEGEDRDGVSDDSEGP